MATRLPASQRTREELAALIEGHLSTASGKDELVKLATRLIVEEALEGEAGDTIGRDYYEHGAQPGQGYRNGYRTGRLKTAEGLMEYSAPQIAGRAEPFRSAIREHLKGHTQGLEDLAIEMLARGLSRALDGRSAAFEAERHIEAFRRAFGRLPDFIDGHQHVHLLPQVGDALLAVMKARTPAAWVRQCGRTSPFLKRGGHAKAHLLDVLSRRMKSRAYAIGVPTNPGFAGAYDFGHRSSYDAVFASFLDGLPDEGVVMCHPGFVDAELERLDHLTAMREQEYAFLAGEEFPKLLAERGFALS